MSSKKIKWGILGTSYISEVMAQAIKASTSAELVAIASRSATTGIAFAEKYSIPNRYADYHLLLNDPAIDAIYIGLPNHLHHEWVIHCAQAGKHILCEKPLFLTSKEANTAYAAIDKANVFCLEALMYRYHPLTEKLQTLIADNIIGSIKLITATYSANIAAIANPTSGGAIRNLGCYPISLVRLLAQHEPIAMTSMGRLCTSTGNDNQASVILTFPNHIMAVVSTADDLDMYWQFIIYGSEGSLQVLSNPWLPNEKENIILITSKDHIQTEITVTAEKSLYVYQIDALNNKIRGHGASYDQRLARMESLANIVILENWLQQVKSQHSIVSDSALSG